MKSQINDDFLKAYRKLPKNGREQARKALSANVQADHVHLVLSIAPKYAISKIVGYLKGKLALRVLSRYPNLHQKYWGNHL